MNDCLKYVMYNDGTLDSFVMFPMFKEHSLIARQMNIDKESIVSAGFVSIQDDSMICFGESVSLNVKSRDEDTTIINRNLGIKLKD